MFGGVTIFLGVILFTMLVKRVSQDLWNEREDLKAGAISLALGGLYLAAALGALALFVTGALLLWKLLLFAWS